MIIGVADNPNKKPLLNIDERISIIKNELMGKKKSIEKLEKLVNESKSNNDEKIKTTESELESHQKRPLAAKQPAHWQPSSQLESSKLRGIASARCQLIVEVLRG